MPVRFATVVAWIVACAAAVPAMAADPASAPPLTLGDAFVRVADAHPELRLFGIRQELLATERTQAEQRPAWIAGAQLENAFGTGETRGLDGAELTLTLASVLERGGKLDARRTLAQSRIDALAVERETTRLDLLAETARRYLAIVAAAGSTRLAEEDVAQRARTVAAARQRLQAGASPESVLLTAQAALARAELSRDRAQRQAASARLHLAALWGARSADFSVAGDPLQLPGIDGLDALEGLLQRTPELARFADERRIAEARLQLARSSATADLEWQVGIRRLQSTDDTALVAGFSMPLGARDRAQPQIRAAEVELAALEIGREAAGLALYSTLVDAHGRYLLAQEEVRRLGADVLPRLARAGQAAERAYRAGAISYLEWAQLQSESNAAHRQQLEVAVDAQRALIEIQRLTGQAFVAGPANAQGAIP